MRRFGKGLGSLTPRLAPLTISQAWSHGAVAWGPAVLGDLPFSSPPCISTARLLFLLGSRSPNSEPPCGTDHQCWFSHENLPFPGWAVSPVMGGSCRGEKSLPFPRWVVNPVMGGVGEDEAQIPSAPHTDPVHAQNGVG